MFGVEISNERAPMKGHWIALLAIATLSTGTTAEYIATWSWRVVDTAGNTGFVAKGESALLTLSVAFDPPQPQPGGGFASASYDILGDDAWKSGLVSSFSNLLCPFSCGDVQSNNDIVGVWNYQAPSFFNPFFNSDNPIDLVVIRWTPSSYDGQTVTLSNGGPVAHVYTDEFGTTVPFAGTGGIGSFVVVPSPGGLAALAVAAIAAAGIRRRRG